MQPVGAKQLRIGVEQRVQIDHGPKLEFRCHLLDPRVEILDPRNGPRVTVGFPLLRGRHDRCQDDVNTTLLRRDDHRANGVRLLVHRQAP